MVITLSPRTIWCVAAAREKPLSIDTGPRLVPASMKLSSTFFGPAFSKSMSSLLPSTATIRP